jgi:N6-L-threonylcarbamoyladenine synthase
MERKAVTIGGPVLGIESSCDETAAAILAPDGAILAERVLSQLADHAAFGGVVPEIAARAHLAALGPLVADAMAEAGISFADLGAIAATAGPGLIGGLIIGSGFAKGAALAANKPYLAINHLEAHALTARLPGLVPAQPEFPYLLLLVSGGHCQCVAVNGVGKYRRLGSTLDDAVGEAFDKTAKLLGLPYPGGPALEAAARDGDPQRFALPRPMIGRPNADFSLSGLKTATRLAAERAAPLSQRDVADLCASFQAAVVDVIVDRMRVALGLFQGAAGVARAIVIAGGVASNGAIREALQRFCAQAGVPLVAPPAKLCTDNGAMIAWAGVERLRLGPVDDLAAPARPRWPLDLKAAPALNGKA